MLLSPCSLILACYSFLFIHNAISCNSAETLFVTFFFSYCRTKLIRVCSWKDHLIQVGFVNRQAGHLQRISGPSECLKRDVAMLSE